MSDITNSANFINLSDVTARVDELREERAAHDLENGTKRDEEGRLCQGSDKGADIDGEPLPGTWEAEESDDAEELERLTKLLEALDNCGAGHEWNGNRYPSELIADHYFTEFAQNTAEECGDISREASYIVVDWSATASAMQQDYKQVDYDGETYWHRA